MGVIINFHQAHDLDWFENIICFLKKKYSPVHLSELINLYKNDNILKNTCHLTIDDGDRSFYNIMYPVLKKHKIPATIFVSSDAAINQTNFWFQEIDGYEKQKLLKILSDVNVLKGINLSEYSLFNIFKCLKIDLIWEIIYRYQKQYNPDKKPCQNMTVNELKEVEKSGLVTVGAHTLRHPILANEETAISKNEIISSLNNLADILGHEINCFAYPNGLPFFDFGQREKDILKEYGCKCSFSTVFGNFDSGSDLLNISRYGLSSGDSKSYIKSKFLFNSYWNKIVELKPGNESVDRRMLLKLLKVTKEESNLLFMG
jgi:peptidoglycan/xylan/chitin deacetylase (PgdA/CDA1 family)